MNRRRKLWAVGLLLFAEVAWADPLLDAIHRPPESVVRGENVRLSVVAPASPAGLPTVDVHHRLEGSNRFDTVRLQTRDGRTHSGEIPASATQGLAVRYYVEVIEADGVARTTIGSADQPVSVQVNRQELDRGAGWIYKAAAAGFLFVLLPIWMRLRRRRRERVDLDQRFWIDLLTPLVDSRGQVLADQVTRLAESLFQHPTRGLVSLESDEIRRRLREFRAEPANGTDEQPPTPPGVGTAEATRERWLVLAADIRRMCTAAWLLSKTTGATGEQPDLDAFPLRKRAEQLVRDTRRALEENRIEAACCSLNELSNHRQRLQTEIANVDRACSSVELERVLSAGNAMTAEMLGNLLEYYALGCSPSPESREKLEIVAVALAARDAVTPNAPAEVRAALERRGLLQNELDSPLDPDLVAGSRKLGRRISAMDVSAQSDLSSIRCEVRAFGDALGQARTTAAGLFEIVALKLALKQQQTAIERAKAAASDELIGKLDQAVNSDTQATAPTQQPADLEASVLLRATESQLRQAIANGNYEEQGLFLDESEIEAVSEAADPARASLMIRAAACRVTLDRVVRRHTRDHQSGGDPPPPLPESTGDALKQHAHQLESELQVSVEKELSRGNDPQSKITSRLRQRLARARMGLEVLAGMPTATDTASASVESPPSLSQAGFLYLEALLAVVILSMALLGIVPLFVSAVTKNAASKDLTVASVIAQDKLEELKSTNTLAAGADAIVERNVTFDRVWTVAADTPHPGLATVTVTVTPQRAEPFGRPRSVSMRFYRVP